MAQRQLWEGAAQHKVSMTGGYLIVDSTIIRATITPPVQEGGEIQALGRSRGDLSTRLHMAVRGQGCPVHFTVTAGQKGDAPQPMPG